MYDFFIISSIVIIMITLFSIRSGITESNSILAIIANDTIKTTERIRIIEIILNRLSTEKIEDELNDIERAISSVEYAINGVDSRLISIDFAVKRLADKFANEEEWVLNG